MVLIFEISNMVVSNLKGGLGNQMFAYAAAYVFAKERNSNLKIALTHLQNHAEFKNETPRDFQLDFFNIKCEFASKEEVERVKKNYSKGFSFLTKLDEFLILYNIIKYPLFSNISPDVYMNSYFQNEKYFVQYSDEIRELFTLRKKFLTKDFIKVRDLIRGEKDSVSIHIRRGDYVTNKKANKWHGTLGEEYYYNALRYLEIQKGVTNPNLFIFSDDCDWVKENLDFGDRVVHYISDRFNPAQSIILMSECKNHIIANSSFSWWGAWLNRNKKKVVIAPSKWLAHGDGPHKGIVPKSWIRLS